MNKITVYFIKRKKTVYFLYVLIYNKKVSLPLSVGIGSEVSDD